MLLSAIIKAGFIVVNYLIACVSVACRQHVNVKKIFKKNSGSGTAMQTKKKE